jgi:ribosomal protein S18 acetylase RimI-like enzyme
MMNHYVIKQAISKAELTAAFGLIHALAVHENSEASFKITRGAFIRKASGQSPVVNVLIALVDDTVVGVTTYVTRFHIWNNSQTLELDDLYVNPDIRGKGIGKSLLQTVGNEAKKLGAAVKWQVKKDNLNAIKLYKQIGAKYTESGICFWQP